MQYLEKKSNPVLSARVLTDLTENRQANLPILPGMTDAENQPIKLDLPDEVLSRLRNWK